MDTMHATAPQRGAYDGLYIGLYLSAFFFVMAQSVYTPQASWLNILSIAIMLGCPVVTYLLLRRSYRLSGGTLGLGSLWGEGVVAYLLGSMITVAAGYLYIRFFNPSFITDLYERAISQWELMLSIASGAEADSYRELIGELKRQLAAGETPTPLSMLASLAVSSTVIGAVMSLLMGLLARARRV